MKWDRDFVKARNPEGLSCTIEFSRDASKGAAIVVSGESGSGKTWSAKNQIPDDLGKENLALIYCSVDDNDGHSAIKADIGINAPFYGLSHVATGLLSMILSRLQY